MTDSLEEQLYKSLKNCPCKCQFSWKVGPYNAASHDTNEGRIRTFHCSACKACERYEKEKGIA